LKASYLESEMSWSRRLCDMFPLSTLNAFLISLMRQESTIVKTKVSMLSGFDRTTTQQSETYFWINLSPLGE